MFTDYKKQAMKATNPFHDELALIRTMMKKEKQWQVVEEKKIGKPIISLLNPQVDLYDGLYEKKPEVVSIEDRYDFKVRPQRDSDSFSSVGNSSYDSMSDKTSSDSEKLPEAKATRTPQLSCCSSDLS